MEFTIEKSGSFEYGHRLPDHTGKCRFWHGHSATVNVRICGIKKLNKENMIIDFGDLKAFVSEICEVYDHKMLVSKTDNTRMAIHKDGLVWTDGQPTAERIAADILKRFMVWVELLDIDYGWLEVDFFEGPNSMIIVRHKKGWKYDY